MFHQWFGIFGEWSGEFESACENIFLNLHGIGRIEWVYAYNHFLDQNTQTPPVDWCAVALFEDHFGCDVVRSATQCVCSGWDVFGEPKVYELQVAIIIHH